MKVALVYTSTTPELIELVESRFRECLGTEAELVSYMDSSILDEVRKAGNVTAGAAAKLIGMYMQAVLDGADAIVNICSSVGEVADSAQDLARFIGVPIIRIDEHMCREAVRRGRRIGIMATLNSTLIPTRNTVLRVAREAGKDIELRECVVEGAFALAPEKFIGRLTEAAGEIAADVDVIILAQGSMAYAVPSLEKAYGKPFLGSPEFGALHLKKELELRGCL